MVPFKNLSFKLIDDKIFLTKCGDLEGIESTFAQVHIAYPSATSAAVEITEEGVTVNFTEGACAVFLELSLF